MSPEDVLSHRFEHVGIGGVSTMPEIAVAGINHYQGHERTFADHVADAQANTRAGAK